MSNNVKIMRGISGSGKSTYARKLCEDATARDEKSVICSADDYFLGPNGYKFDAAKLGAAHSWCLRNFIQWLQEAEHDLVVVDNTNLNLEDISPYVAVGTALHYDVEIIQVNTPPEVAAGRNIHGVSRSHVIDMHKRLTNIKLPFRFKVTNINP
jgi:predicted kinase